MIKVILFDSHPIIFRGIKEVFKELGKEFVFIETSDADELFACLDQRQINLVVAGINENSNLDPKIIRKYKSTPWIILYNDNLYKKALACFLSGARGLLSKSANYVETIYCCREVFEDRFYICERTSHSLSQELLFDYSCRDLLRLFLKAKSKQLHKKLTSREKEVASLLLRGFRTSEIAERLNLKITTISTMKRSILYKNNARSIVELAGSFH